MEIKGKTTMEAWKKAIKFVIKEGEDFKDENQRICREFLNLSIQIDEPEKDAEKPLQKIKQIKDFIYPSKLELEYSIMSREKNPSYRYTYGERIFNKQGRDQVGEYIKPLLTKQPHSRRAVISIWDAKTDSFVEEKDTPGITTIHLKIKNKKLHLTASIRSNDIFFGFPTNIYQLSLLHKKIAEELNISTGLVTIFSNSAHIFKDQYKYIKKIINKKKRKPFKE